MAPSHSIDRHASAVVAAYGSGVDGGYIPFSVSLLGVNPAHRH
jgi:hypothetical protein